MTITPHCLYTYTEEYATAGFECFVQIDPFVYAFGVLIFILALGLIVWRR